MVGRGPTLRFCARVERVDEVLPTWGNGRVTGDDLKPDRILPEDPLRFIQRCVEQRKIRWTYHVNMRLRRRYVPREAILESTNAYEIIESYPEDKYLPSYLVYSKHQERVFHALFAADVEGANVRVVTAYEPDLQKWEEDFKTRRAKS